MQDMPETASETGIEVDAEPADKTRIEIEAKPADKNKIEIETKPADKTGIEIKLRPAGKTIVEKPVRHPAWSSKMNTAVFTQDGKPYFACGTKPEAGPNGMLVCIWDDGSEWEVPGMLFQDNLHGNDGKGTGKGGNDGKGTGKGGKDGKGTGKGGKHGSKNNPLKKRRKTTKSPDDSDTQSFAPQPSWSAKKNNAVFTHDGKPHWAANKKASAGGALVCIWKNFDGFEWEVPGVFMDKDGNVYTDKGKGQGKGKDKSKKGRKGKKGSKGGYRKGSKGGHRKGSGKKAAKAEIDCLLCF